ncbi:MAG: alkaline phosphatase family protein [Acidobacteriota bacterium]
MDPSRPNRSGPYGSLLPVKATRELPAAETKRSRRPPRWGRVAASRGLLLGGLLLIAAASACGGGAESPTAPAVQPTAASSPLATSGRIVVLGMDGLEPTELERRISQGELPHFARMMNDGAYGPLESAYPLLSPILWTTLATGRHPLDHGVSDFTVKNPTTGAEVPVTSSVRRVPALWNLFSDAQQQVASVGWWATWPAEPVQGVMVSDRVGLHFLLQDRVVSEELPAITFPEEVLPRIRQSMIDPQDLSPELLRRFTNAPPNEVKEALQQGVQNDLVHLSWAVATARSYRAIGLELLEDLDPRLLLVYFEITDTLAHLFGHLHRQQGLAGELAQQQQRFGDAVTAAYDLADEILGDYLDALGPDDVLLIVSDHGFRLGVLPTDLSTTRAEDMRRVSDEYHELYGVLMLYGAGVQPRGRLQEAQLLDFAPTVLAIAGIPPSEEMPGRVLFEAFEEAWAVERIASYEGRAPGEATADSGAVDEALMEKLRSLGYIGGSGDEAPGPTRNLAAIALEEGRFREAARAYNRLLAESPEDGRLHADFSASLLGLGRAEEALASAERAVELAPTDALPLFRRGQAQEALGRRGAAVEDYRRALQYQPGHRPSRRSLERLGESIAARAQTEEQRQAQGWLTKAQEAVQRGDLPAAHEALDQAEALVPNTAVVHQYRANVFFLAGDREQAAESLRRALELDPENAQLRENLRRLESSS